MSNEVFAIAGGKGGVGKTTVTANVGVALQQKGYDVAAIDADLAMTNLGELVNIDVDTGIHHVLAGKTTVEEVLVDGPAGLDIVPGTSGLEEVGNADPANLKKALNPLREDHDIVLIDTGAGVSHQSLVALGLADATVLVSTPTDVSATDAGKTADMVDRVEGTVAGVVVTRTDDQTAAAEIAAGFETDLLSVIPEYQEIDASEPRYDLAPESPAASAYDHLADALAVYYDTGDTIAAVDREIRQQEQSLPRA